MSHISCHIIYYIVTITSNIFNYSELLQTWVVLEQCRLDQAFFPFWILTKLMKLEWIKLCRSCRPTRYTYEPSSKQHPYIGQTAVATATKATICAADYYITAQCRPPT